jgi:hypothetical protein
MEDSPVAMSWRTNGAGEALFEAVHVPAGDYPKAIKRVLGLEIDYDINKFF